MITSSSSRELGDFFAEIRRLGGRDVLFDLFVLREEDVRSIARTNPALKDSLVPQAARSNPPNIASIVARPELFESIRAWLIDQCRTAEVGIAALATYFPDATSPYKKHRDTAVAALINTVRLGLELVDAKIARSAIVELVAGTIADRCTCKSCTQEGRVYFVDDDEQSEKLDLLTDSLKRVVDGVENLQASGGAAKGEFALGVELEPGDTYVINSESRIAGLFRRIDGDAQLKAHVGLNLDIAHMRLVPIAAERLIPYRTRIVHAHISDHPPGMHTRDQSIGRWSDVTRVDNGYTKYVRELLLKPRPAERQLPHSGAVALELEGCNRLQWVLDSLTAMQRLFTMAGVPKRRRNS